MSTDINSFKLKLNEIKDWLIKELSSIRTGRATITLLDGVMVDSYGSKTPINQVASINLEDPKTIRIVPWDKSLVKEIEGALNKADMGVSVSTDTDGARVRFPDLTTEVRDRLVKTAYAKIEEAKVSVRNKRGEIIKALEASQKAGEMSEDDLKRKKDEVQKLVDEKIREFDEIGGRKENEIKN